MRLLLCGKNGKFTLTEPLVDEYQIPPYAILSHRWLEEKEEPTFEDLMNSTAEKKLGYKKIRLCGEQARQDGICYFWVDTCCINKKNPAEHSQAINSMFRWYRNATRCYVYLSDVPSPLSDTSDEFNPQSWDSDFWKSEWFTRGWTLQELLAPRSIEFFSREWKQLGSKKSLNPQIQKITGVPASALQGGPLSQFTVDERVLWIERRQTKLEEDKVYSLLGILDVRIPLFYGEGGANALKRVREVIDKREKCVQDLRITDPRDDIKRIAETKGGLLEDSYRWILENSEFQQWHTAEKSPLLWIRGDPGKGKTMLLYGIIKELDKSTAETALLSYFFCQATDSRINNATAVLRGLIYMLVDQRPSLVSHIQKKHDHAGKTLFEDVNSWFALSEIFTNILQDLSMDTTYLIIDALDECVNNWPKLLDFVIRKSAESSRVKWIVSSRNLLAIEEQLNLAQHKMCLSLELNAKSISTAVNIFIQRRVFQLTQRKEYNKRTQAAVLHYLSSNADNTFLWVALVCQNLEKIPRGNTIAKLGVFPPGLDSVYERMLQQIRNSDYADLCRRVLATIAIVFRPIALSELTALIEIHKDMSDDFESIREIINLCGSILTIRKGTIYFVHQSAKDFLFEKAFDEIFPSGKSATHHQIFSRSLKAMSATLRRDMYSLQALGYHIERVKQPESDPLEAIRYSCTYWVDHVCDWSSRSHTNQGVHPQDGGAIEDFIRSKYLYWLEALSLCGGMSEGVVSIAKLETLLQTRTDVSALLELVRDARRFIMYHKQAIENYPLQAYASALMFSPAGSLIRGLFTREQPKWFVIQPSMIDEWSLCLQTLEGHCDAVRLVAFSHDSTRLASASHDNTVKIWDAGSGACLQTLEGYGDAVRSVAFSHDSTRLASSSPDGTVKIWDAGSGACLQTLEGHGGAVWSVAFSHDLTRLASASNDSTVKIWDTGRGACLQMLEGYGGAVWSVAFSHDSTRLASASPDGTVKIWDTGSGACLQTLEGYGDAVWSVTFSHDSTRLASASHDNTVKIWDTGSGACLQTLEGHGGAVRSVAFSHDSTRLASASHDVTVKIWDTGSGACLQTLESHGEAVRSVVFSHDSTRLASASNDVTVKIWDAGSGACLQTLESHGDSVWSVVISHDSTRLASASNDNTVKIWDTGSGACLQTLKGHDSAVRSVAFSHDSTRLASASPDGTVKIWDAGSGACLQTLEGYGALVWSVAFSHDSTRLASTSLDGTVKIWDAGSGACLQMLKGHGDAVWSVVFSYDSTRLASTSSDSTVKIWDAGSGACLQTLEGHGGAVWSVAFSHDSTRLVSASHDGTVKIWDTGSGACLQTLAIGKSLYNISFDVTDSYLHTDIGIIPINAPSASYETANVSKHGGPQYQGGGLSADAAWITYNSENLVRLPSEYRPSCSAVSAKTVGAGVATGKVWMCNFIVENI